MDGDPGPKATPVYEDGKIFVYDPAGTMFCLDALDGNTVWQKDLAEKYGTNKGYFGIGTSPIVCGDKVVVNAGGRDASVVALDKKTGDEAWAVFDDRASYSSPVQLTIDNKQVVVVVTRLHVIGIEVSSGKLAFKMRFGKTGPTAIGAMPVVLDDKVFINGAYNVGGKTLALSGGEKSFGDDGFEPKTMWSDPKVFASQYSTPVEHEGLLYGTSGREDFRNGSFRCFDPLTGQLKWTQPDVPVGHSLLIQGRIVFLDHKSNLRLIEPSSDRYKQLAEFKLYRSASKTIPAMANGRLYTRSDGTNATLDCWSLN
jgi:outer membrane protein assembly factor BamB